MHPRIWLVVVGLGAVLGACGASEGSLAFAEDAGVEATGVGGAGEGGGGTAGADASTEASAGKGGGGSGGTSGKGGTGGAGGGTGGASGTGGSSGKGGTGGAGGAPSCSACLPLEECWASTLCVAKKTAVPGNYYIDATEVTRAQYGAWLATNPDPGAGQPTYCAWNMDFHPETSCMAKACQASCDTHPQVCVDWCDAYAYCKAVGKRLCGQIGGGAGSFDEFTTATKNQWYAVCSSGGTRNYPYGGDTAVSGSGFVADVCNGQDYWNAQDAGSSATTLPAALLAGCVSPVTGYEGIFDLSGNAGEWDDSCDASAGGDDTCRYRGGMYWGNYGHLQCTSGWTSPRHNYAEYIGFRCCSNP
jgi:formylglycine-generating enzyme